MGDSEIRHLKKKNVCIRTVEILIKFFESIKYNNNNIHRLGVTRLLIATFLIYKMFYFNHAD